MQAQREALLRYAYLLHVEGRSDSFDGTHLIPTPTYRPCSIDEAHVCMQHVARSALSAARSEIRTAGGQGAPA
jgi:hypothetical protein